MRIHKLEKALLKTLVNPQESDQRKRYVKRLIYGEEVQERVESKFTAEKEQVPTKTSIWSALQKMITGDEYLDYDEK